MSSWNTNDKINSVRKLAVITFSVGMGFMLYVIIMTFFITQKDGLQLLVNLNYPVGFSGMCLFGIGLYLEHKARQLERMQT